MEMTERTRFALTVVREASILAREIQRKMVSGALAKEDRSPVTVADFSVQALVGRRLEEEYPGEPLVAEESSKMLSGPEGEDTLRRVGDYLAAVVRDAGSESVRRWIDRGGQQPARRFWVLDPIDGTKGFLRGDQYVVALALIERGNTELGVLGCPRLNLRPGGVSKIREARQVEVSEEGCMLVAGRDKGAWVTPLQELKLEKLNVSDNHHPGRAVILRSVEAGHTNLDLMERIVSRLGTATDPLPVDSQAKYALLAAGAGDLLLRLISPTAPDYREKIWDHAAGALIVKEAGGRVTDLEGRELDFQAGRRLENNRGLLASNGALHPAALEALRIENSRK